MADNWGSFSIHVSISNVTTTSATATAQLIIGANGSMYATVGYTLSRSGGGSSSGTKSVSKAKGSSQTINLGSWNITGLSAGTSYTINMSFDPKGTKINGVAMPSMSTSNSFTTNGSIPAAPSSVTISPEYFYRGQSITISWPAVSGATKYEEQWRYWNPDGAGWTAASSWSSSINRTSTSFTDSWNNLNNYLTGCSIQYRIRAVNSSGTSAWKNSNYGYMCGRVRIKVGSNWKYGIGWIKVNGTWERARCIWINVNGTWKRGY